MSGFELLKLNVHYGGKMYAKNNTFVYERGSVKKDMKMDPDYMTWSVFDGFCEDAGLSGQVDQVWYKLPHEDMYEIRAIFEESSDADIMKMCAEAIGSLGELDIYLEQVVPPDETASERAEPEETASERAEPEETASKRDEPEETANKRDEPEENADKRVEVEENADKRVEVEENAESSEESSDDDEGAPVHKPVVTEPEEEVVIEEQPHEDPRFAAFFEEVHSEEVRNEEAPQQSAEVCNEEAPQQSPENIRGPNPTHASAPIDDGELERQCGDAALPSHVVDTDDEWEDFNKTERECAREACQAEDDSYLRLLQTFNSGDEFKDQVLRYVLKTNFDVKLCRWEKTKLAAICTKKTCSWKIYCSVEQAKRKWMVKTYVGEHNHLKSGKARMLKQGVIAHLFKDEARRRPEIRWTDIKDEIMMRYNLSVSKWICQKARRMALDLVIESQQEQFNKLYDYEAGILRTHPRTTTEIVTIPQVNGDPLFDKFYCCFEALRTSWKRCCRPIIGLDGAFLKWELKGEVLAAVGRDADNRIYPIAWAVVRVEDNESWAWFVEKLIKDLDLGQGNGLTVISDKQKGLINVVQDLLPDAEHRHCARHVYANWSKVYRLNEYESYFWAIAYSCTVGDYEYNMKALKEFDAEAHEDLLKTGTKSWCRAFLSHTPNCEDVSNNLSESFNRTIKEARKLPMISMLQEIRRLAMGRNSRRHDKTRKCKTKFPPNIMEIFEANRRAQKFCSVVKSSESLYEVTDETGSYSVCLAYKHCACNQWNLTGIPCPHAIHVITELNRDPEDYVDSCYLTTTWQDTYSDNINPVNGEREWPKHGKGGIRVPEKRKRRGRKNKYHRFKEPTESTKNPTKATRQGRTVTCSNCRQSGHNVSTCKNAPATATGPKRKRGRPRKDGKEGENPEDDPWSIQNITKRRNAASQQIPSASSSQNPEEMHPSTAPVGVTSTTRHPARGTGRPRGRPRGRGRGRGRETSAPIPRDYACLISPWSGRVFEEWGTNPDASKF